jgi:hypothetical protein
LVDVDGQADALFREALRNLKNAGADLVEIDLGGDFLALTARTTWPIFFHETLPAVRAFLAANEVPVSFEQIYAGLGEQIKQIWSRSVVPSSASYISEETYRSALNAHRHELRGRLTREVELVVLIQLAGVEHERSDSVRAVHGALYRRGLRSDVVGQLVQPPREVLGGLANAIAASDRFHVVPPSESGSAPKALRKACATLLAAIHQTLVLPLKMAASHALNAALRTVGNGGPCTHT